MLPTVTNTSLSFPPTPSSMGTEQVHSESTECIFSYQLAPRFIDLDQVEVSWAEMSFSSADWNTADFPQ